MARTRVFRIGLLDASRIARAAVIEPARAGEGFVVSAVAARERGRARAYAREGEAVPYTGGADAIANMTAIDAIYRKARP